MVHCAVIVHRSHQQSGVQPDPATTTPDTYLLVAAEPQVIDKWWLSMSKKKELKCKRETPDWYSYEGPKAISDFDDSITSGDRFYRWAPVFEANYLLHALQQPQRVDLVSGRRYYIQSSRDPTYYWSLRRNWEQTDSLENRALVNRDTSRETFTLHIQGQEKEARVLLPNDKVIIRHAGEKRECVGFDGSCLQLDTKGKADVAAFFIYDFSRGKFKPRYDYRNTGRAPTDSIETVSDGSGEDFHFVAAESS